MKWRSRKFFLHTIVLLGLLISLRSSAGIFGFQSASVQAVANAGPSASTVSDVEAVTFDSSGRRLLGGNFWSFGPRAPGIVRTNTDGTADSTFDAGAGFNNPVRSIVVQADGKVVVGGDFSDYRFDSNVNLTRINSDGTQDTGFSPQTNLNGSVKAIALQSDQKIVIGGDFLNYGASRKRLARINTDGTLDTTFAVGTGFNNSINSVAIQSSDGKIIVGGAFTTYKGVSQVRIARLNTDGTLDATFAVGTGFTGGAVQAIAIQADGKVVVCGAFTTYQGTGRARLARLNSDGTYDATFVIGTGFNGQCNSLAIQGDGKILAAGTFTTYKGLSQGGIVRLNSDGSLDSTLAIGTGINPSLDTIFAMALQSDGKIIIGGIITAFNGSAKANILRLTSTGGVDGTFNVGTGFDGDVYAIALQSDSKPIIAGAMGSYNGTNVNARCLIRQNADGSPDTAFNNNASGCDGKTHKIIVQSDGKIMVAGAFNWFTTVQDAPSGLARLNSNGTTDATFAHTGTGEIVDMAIQADGKIVIVGNHTNYSGTAVNYITRVNTDGTIDTSLVQGTGFSSMSLSVAIQADQKILVGGVNSMTSYNGTAIGMFVRLNSNGSIDGTFNMGTGFDNAVNTIVVQADGKILVGGGFGTYNGTAVSNLVRLNSDGTLDTTFNTNIGTGPDNTVNSIAIDPVTSKIIVGGWFQNFNGHPARRIVRLNSDGTMDKAFNSRVGFDHDVAGVAINPTDRKILVGGHFNSFGNLRIGTSAVLAAP